MPVIELDAEDLAQIHRQSSFTSPFFTAYAAASDRRLKPSLWPGYQQGREANGFRPCSHHYVPIYSGTPSAIAFTMLTGLSTGISIEKLSVALGASPPSGNNVFPIAAVTFPSAL